MAMATLSECVEQIGKTAGDLWHLLDEHGPIPLTRLIKQCDAPRDVTLQAIGWLAREEKISIDEEGRKKIVSLI